MGSLLLAHSRHPDRVRECPLSGVKQTSKFKSVTSAFDPKRTSASGFCCNARQMPRSKDLLYFAAILGIGVTHEAATVH